MRFQTLRIANRKRNEESFPMCADWTGTDWATALAGEVGELCNLVKKHRRGDTIKAEDIGKEIADVIVYADLVAQYFGISLGAYVIKKFNEVSDRVGSPVKLELMDETEYELLQCEGANDNFKSFLESRGLMDDFENYLHDMKMESSL